MKETTRNPKANPNTVIEVVTKPVQQNSDPLRNDRNMSAPNHFVLTNPEPQVLGDIDSLKKQIA